MADDESLGKYIRNQREQLNMSLLDLSTRSGVAYSHLSRIENESTIPNPETIVKIADQLEGDLTLMLQKANNLPRVILERLLERDSAIRLQTLQRAVDGADGSCDNAGDDLARLVENAKLTNQDVADFRAGISDLLMLAPHARRAVLLLISTLTGDEGDGAPD
jgi:transcriptional regulator with XRE-family HTH domain